MPTLTKVIKEVHKNGRLFEMGSYIKDGDLFYFFKITGGMFDDTVGLGVNIQEALDACYEKFKNNNQ